jgi:hypothetical protein
MSKAINCRIWAAAAGALLLGLGACDREPAEEVVTPQNWLENAVSAWNSTKSFHFTLVLNRRAVPLDPSGLLSYNDVEGDVVAPDRVQAQATVKTPVGNTPVAFISIGENQWLTNPLTRQWGPAPPQAAGGVGDIFDPQTGIGPTLANMGELQQGPDETLEGVPVVKLTGTMPGRILSTFAADLATVPRLDVELWVGKDDNRIRQIIVHEPPPPNAPAGASWTFKFSRFDEPISIEPPA